MKVLETLRGDKDKYCMTGFKTLRSAILKTHFFGVAVNLLNRNKYLLKKKTFSIVFIYFRTKPIFLVIRA